MFIRSASRAGLLVLLAGTALLAACKSDKRSDSASTTAAGSAAAPAPAAPAPAPAPAADAPAPAGEYATNADYDAPALDRVDLPSGLIIEELKIGQGDPVLPRAFVTFHYRARIKDGREFDATLNREGGPQPEAQSLARLFPGLSVGLVGAAPGARRRLTIPPHLAPNIVGLKNEQGEVVIPPDATLVYLVDILDVRQQLMQSPAEPPAPAPATPPAPPAPPTPEPRP